MIPEEDKAHQTVYFRRMLISLMKLTRVCVTPVPKVLHIDESGEDAVLQRNYSCSDKMLLQRTHVVVRSNAIHDYQTLRCVERNFKIK